MNTARTILVISSLLLAAGAPHAQTSRGGGGADAQMMQQMQQLASERTQLQAENAKLKKELDDLKKQVKGLESEKTSLSQRAQNAAVVLSRSAAGKDSLEQNLEQQRARMEELIGKFRETATTLREVETEHAQTKGQLATRDQELKSCIDKNMALYKVNVEALDVLEHQGFWSSVVRKEPFTQLKRTEIENLIDDYRGRAEDQREPGGL